MKSYKYPNFEANRDFHLEKRIGANKWESKGKGEFPTLTIEVGRNVLIAGWVTTEVKSITTHGMYVVFQTRNSIYRVSLA